MRDKIKLIEDWYAEVSTQYEAEVVPGISDDSVLEAVRDTLENVLSTLIDQARPAFPTTGVCVCGTGDEWYDCEDGYTRTSSANYGNGVLHVWMDGWDDMSENGDLDRYVFCSACAREYNMPEVVEYDG